MLALRFNTTASEHVAVGYQAAYSNTTGVRLVAVGYQAAYSNTTGTNNVAIGKGALYNNTTGSSHVAIGYGTGVSLTTGLANTFVGNDWSGVWGACGELVTTGSGNSFYGTGSGRVMTTGSKNTIIGSYGGNTGGLDIRTASNNVVLADGDGNIGVVYKTSKFAQYLTSTNNYNKNTVRFKFTQDGGGSGTTFNLLTLAGGASIQAVALIIGSTIYAADTNLGQFQIMVATRTKSDGTWVNGTAITVASNNSGSTTTPVLYWAGGVLKVDVGVYNLTQMEITVTASNQTIDQMTVGSFY
jgi:hypothetical protein